MKPASSPFERLARVLHAARNAVSPIECAHCHLPAKQCELHSDDCRLGDLRRALREYDTHHGSGE